MINKSRIEKYLEQLNQIYFGLISLPLLLFPLVYLPIKDIPSMPLRDNLSGKFSLIWVVALLLFLTMLFARRLFRRSLLVISVNWPLKEKLQAYKRSLVIFYSFGLLASLCSVLLLFITKHQLFVATYPFLLLLISLYRPTVQRLKRELPLSEKELAMIKHESQKTKNIR